MQHGRTVRERLRAELQDWCTDVELDGQNLSIICCPEDKVCAKRCPPGRICSACWAPVCMHCRDSLRAKEASRLALANDMLVFYTPRLIYKEEVTFMELVCASPCFTAMACFSLEKKLLGDRALDQDAFMNRNRLVARGNATTFPLAWEELLQNLQAASTEAAAGEIRLPKVGVELAAVINVIIKAGGPLSERDDAAKIIHQARVRRAVVLQLIADAKAREHPAYNSLNMNEVVQRAEQLPEDGVPAEIVAWLPHDTDLDNVQRQKAATPTRAMLSEADVQAEFAHMCKPNAVVSERTSGGFADPNATHVAALQAAVQTGEARRAETTTAVVYTGNRLLDQFEPWYFAFALLFSSRMELECRIRQAGVPNFGTGVHRMLCASSLQLGCVAWPGAVNLKSIGIGRSDSRVGICISGRQSICLGICPHTTRQSLMKPCPACRRS